jgi:two-component system, OmpR family, response regulator
MSHRPKRKTILVVDDQPQVRRLLRQILDRDGYVVLEAEDERSAVQTVMLHDDDIDLALVDIELPGPHGRKVAAMLDRFGVSETVFITGLDPNQLLAEGRLEAADRLVRKPFTVAGITGAVKAVLRPAPRPIV